MNDSIQDYVAAKEAADIIGIPYPRLIKRIGRKKIKAEKIGYTLLIHKNEVERARVEELKNAPNKNMERPTR